ncbi:hypothetical protein [Endozoicomonas sp. YOMI1]|uniref:hypothetical protein n=1 Tax=Endozoicomonas sp. YOMI1 TaxID=2828739 RepID=UPI002148B88D|nr:hypothetical protein [Endozoicomonas sp. YOMI1]
MKLLNTYDTRTEGESAEQKLVGERRLASERDGTETIYNLFGIPSWFNFYRLGMYDLDQLQQIVEQKKNNQPYDQARHQEILKLLNVVAKNYELKIPEHWL